MTQKEEVLEEIETLKSIYPIEIQGNETNLQIWLKPTDSLQLEDATVKEYAGDEESDHETESELSDDAEEMVWDDMLATTPNVPQLIMTIKYPDTYPDVPPKITLSNVPLEQEFAFLHSHERKELLQQLQQVSEENLGMVHVFSLISHARDYLEYVCSKRVEEAEGARNERIRIADEIDRKRTEGTKVTPQSFAAWKKRFDTEKRVKDPSIKLIKKTTGKQLFEQNKGLVDSDLKELGQDDTVDVDMSLFEAEDLAELDDLEIDEGIHFSESDTE